MKRSRFAAQQLFPVQTRQILMHQSQEKTAARKVVGISLVLLGLMASLIAVTSQQKKVTALPVDTNRLTGNTWRGASFPVENFLGYTSPFGYRRSATGGGGWELHRGLDIAAPQGSYIRNWWGGTVVKVSDGTACGTYVVIRSGAWEHTYCHMIGQVETANGYRYVSDRAGGIQIWEGQQIPAGTRIGRVGMTGRTTGPHLHWGLKYANNYVDPALVLRAMYGQQASSKQSAVKIKPNETIRDSGY